MEATVFYNLITEVISHHFCCNLCIKWVTRFNTHSRGGDYTRGWIPGGGVYRELPCQQLPITFKESGDGGHNNNNNNDSCYLLAAFAVPGTGLNPFCALSHLIAMLLCEPGRFINFPEFLQQRHENLILVVPTPETLPLHNVDPWPEPTELLGPKQAPAEIRIGKMKLNSLLFRKLQGDTSEAISYPSD